MLLGEYIGIEWEVQASVPKWGAKQIFFYDIDMLNYKPSKGINIHNSRIEVFLTKQDYKCASRKVYIDMNNIEIVSKPVKIYDLKKEIKICETKIESVFKRISKRYNYNIGAFLPNSSKSSESLTGVFSLNGRLSKFPSKHVNFSTNFNYTDLKIRKPCNDYLEINNITRSCNNIIMKQADPKYGNYLYRIEVKVPYSFKNYAELRTLIESKFLRLYSETNGLDFTKKESLNEFYDLHLKSYLEGHKDTKPRLIGYVKNRNWTKVRGLC